MPSEEEKLLALFQRSLREPNSLEARIALYERVLSARKNVIWRAAKGSMEKVPTVVPLSKSAHSAIERGLRQAREETARRNFKPGPNHFPKKKHMSGGKIGSGNFHQQPHLRWQKAKRY